MLQALTKDLEAERERRWKAEQAAVKLADHVSALQAQGTYVPISPSPSAIISSSSPKWRNGSRD